MWQRISCDQERADYAGTKGDLLRADALRADLSPWYGKAQCVYIDPPFFTGDRFSFKMRIGEKGWRSGRPAIDLPAFSDFPGSDMEEYVAFLREAIHLAHRLLTPSGSFFLHVDWRTTAQARLLLDDIFGEDQFRNEIIWSYQTGGRSKRYFSRKHDTIYFYAKSRDHYFDITQVPSHKKRDRDNHLKRHVDKDGRTYRSIKSGGKTYIYYDDEPAYPDDVWSDLSQMQQKDPQRTGYATQKPVPLLERIILSTTKPGDLVVDFMCGSGTTLYAAAKVGREFLGVDASRHAYSVCRKRLNDLPLTCRAPLSSVSAMLDATALPGIGFYSVSLNAYVLGGDQLDKYAQQKHPVHIKGLDAVDQWYAGLISNGSFVVYASAGRTKQEPKLPTELEVPLLRGTLAILVIDVLGNRTLWAPSAPV